MEVGQPRASNTKHNGRVAGVGRAPPNVGSTSHSSNSANASGLNNNSNKSVAGNNNSAKGAVSNNGSGNYTAKGVATDKKSKKLQVLKQHKKMLLLCPM